MILLTVTNPSVSDANKKVLWLMARQHAWETGSSWAAHGLVVASFAAYLAGLRRLKKLAVERRAKVRYFPAATPAAPAAAPAADTRAAVR